MLGRAVKTGCPLVTDEEGAFGRAGDASGKSMTRFTFSAGSYRWGDDHPNALARKVKFFIKRGVVRPRHNAWTSDKGLQGKIKEFNLSRGSVGYWGTSNVNWDSILVYWGICPVYLATGLVYWDTGFVYGILVLCKGY